MASGNTHQTGLASRYAKALLELAQEAKAADRVAADFAALRNAIEVSPEFARLVRTPAYSGDEQAKVLAAILEKIEAAPLTRNFIGLLARKRRLAALEAIIAVFNRQLAALKGEVEAEVTSARPLSAAEAQELKGVLKARLGREPLLLTRVDPTLLGGLVVKLGSRMIDSSIRTKLAGIRAAMRGT